MSSNDFAEHTGANILTNFPHLKNQIELPPFYYLPGFVLLASD